MAIIEYDTPLGRVTKEILSFEDQDLCIEQIKVEGKTVMIRLSGPSIVPEHVSIDLLSDGSVNGVGTPAKLKKG